MFNTCANFAILQVYATPVVQRVLWALGFGADVTVPVTVRCYGCPTEPWTYIRKVSGLDPTDFVDGWVDIGLILSGGWSQKEEVVILNSTLAYFDWDLFQPADKIELADGNTPQPGWRWPELYENLTNGTQEWIERDALTVIAAFVSHVDNYNGNQGFNCLYNGSKNSSDINGTCTGAPFMFIHDVGCTLGYGWDLLHKDFWPNACDLTQWLELEMWNDLSQCVVQIHGIPGASWLYTWQVRSIPKLNFPFIAAKPLSQVSEAGRQLAARLMGALTPAQVVDMFTVARINLFMGDSIDAWIAGWQYKLQRDLLNVTCGTSYEKKMGVPPFH